MELSGATIAAMLASIALIMGLGLWLSRPKNITSEGFSLNGRKTSATMITGSLLGVCIGGGSTIGTSQMAYGIGISAVWFTLGICAGLIFMAFFFAKRYRNRGIETLSELLVRTFGKKSGPVSGIIASAGIFFSCAASALPSVFLLSAVLDLPIAAAGAAMCAVTIIYVIFGGMRGTSVLGWIKSAVLLPMFCYIAWLSFKSMSSHADFAAALGDGPWFDIWARGIKVTAENLASMALGIICTQTYVQVVCSATDAKTAAKGCICGALICLPTGIPCVMAALAMRAENPNLDPLCALPAFITEHMPPILAGITLGALLITLISSVAGLVFGMATTFSRDVIGAAVNFAADRNSLLANRLSIMFISAAVIAFVLSHPDAKILEWNFWAMTLRGTISVPVCLALFAPKFMPKNWAIPCMISSAAAASAAYILDAKTIPPLFIGLGAGLALAAIGHFISDRGESSENARGAKR